MEAQRPAQPPMRPRVPLSGAGRPRTPPPAKSATQGLCGGTPAHPNPQPSAAVAVGRGGARERCEKWPEAVLNEADNTDKLNHEPMQWSWFGEEERRSERAFVLARKRGIRSLQRGDTPGRKWCGIKRGGRKRPPRGPHRPATRGGTRACGDWGAGIIGGRFGSLRGSWVA